MKSASLFTRLLVLATILFTAAGLSTRPPAFAQDVETPTATPREILPIPTETLLAPPDIQPAPPNQNPGPEPGDHSAIISNGTVQLGVRDQGHLNVSGGTPSAEYGSTVVGLRYVPTNGDGLSPGCFCEGWGAADARTGTTGYANVSVDGVRNMTLVSFTSTDSTATSIVNIGNKMQVTHAYHPSPKSPLLYQIDVTVENISTAEIDLRYRRVMDWDVQPFTFFEYVTIQGTTGNPQVLYASNNGFETANPMGQRSSLGYTGDFVDAGPGDHGALFDFGLGIVPAGQLKRFTLYYGAAGNEADAQGALAAVGARVYSLGESYVGKTTGQPNTYLFGFANNSPSFLAITDSAGNPVNELALNSNGWPTPNPLIITVTLSCPADSSDCYEPFSFKLNPSVDSGRFYIYDATLLPTSGGCQGDSPRMLNSYPGYFASCPLLKVPAGQTITYTLKVWIQPSEAAPLNVLATYGQTSGTQTISIPQAAIHPVALIPGFGSLHPLATEAFYTPLLKTLEQMGYERDKTLFPWHYSLAKSSVDVADELADEMSAWQTAALGVRWVWRTPEKQTAFDIVGHSVGALVTRTYMQLTPDADYTPLNKLLLVAGLNKGILASYAAREGLRSKVFFFQSLLGPVLAQKAHDCGNYTVKHIFKRGQRRTVLVVTDEHKYKTLHERRCGIHSLPEYLPVTDEGIPAYLVNNNGNPYPYPAASGSPNGYQYNPLLQGPPTDLNSYPQKDPWWLPSNPNPGTTYYNLNGRIWDDLARRNIDASNVHVFFSDNLETHETYMVTVPSSSSLLWRNGVWSTNNADTIKGPGDDAVAAYSARAPDLWPGFTPHRLVFLEHDPVTGQDKDIRLETHGNLPVYPESQQEIGLTLTGIRPPFSNPLGLLNRQPADARVLHGFGLSPIEFLVTDPQGRRLGYDPTTGQILQEIPLGFYDHPTGEPLGFTIHDPLAGDYTLTVTGTGTGPYTLLDVFTDEQTSVPILFEENAIQVGETYITTMTVPAKSGDVPYPPEVDAGADFSVAVGTPAEFNGTIEDINPDDTFDIQWDFGNGSTASGTLIPSYTYSIPGPHTVTLTVTDSAGFVISDTLAVTVTYFTGFFQPIENLPTLNTVKPGSAVPMKFSLNGNWGLNIFEAGYPASKSMACGSTATDASETTLTAGSSSLSYDSASDQYTYVWKTDKAWANTCRTLIVKLNDGTYQRANFKFTK